MRIGILGKGQLGQMLAEAAAHLGDTCCFYEHATERFFPSFHCTAGQVITGPRALAHFVESSDVLTFETENADNALAQALAEKRPFYPPVPVLKLASDRWEEKRTFESLGIPTAPFVCVSAREDLEQAAQQLGFPFVLKTATEGYDGKGQAVMRSTQDLQGFLLAPGMRYLAEAWVDYVREVSIVGTRTASGEYAFYPMGQNAHVQGILAHCYITESLVSSESSLLAQRYLRALMDSVEYVGTMALELFELPDGGLMANECAPRVHNTGHWTIEGTSCSQFENHIRAITGRALGETSMRATAVAMGNIIGQMPNVQAADPNIFWHDYGKSARPGRKLGHVTVLGESQAVLNTLESLPITPVLA